MPNQFTVNNTYDEFVGAIRSRNTQKALALLKQKDIRSYAQINNNLALILAASRGLCEVVNDLLSIPLVLKQAHAQDNLAFREAVEHGYTQIVSELLKIPEVQENAHIYENIAFKWACERGYLEIVDKLLELPEILLQVANHNNEALRWACRNGHIKIVKRLLHINNIRKQAGVLHNQSLALAAANNHPLIVEELLGVDSVQKEISHFLKLIRASNYHYNRHSLSDEVRSIFHSHGIDIDNASIDDDIGPKLDESIIDSDQKIFHTQENDDHGILIQLRNTIESLDQSIMDTLLHSANDRYTTADWLKTLKSSHQPQLVKIGHLIALQNNRTQETLRTYIRDNSSNLSERIGKSSIKKSDPKSR